MNNYIAHNIEKSTRLRTLKAIFFLFCGAMFLIFSININNQRFINPVIESHALSAKEIKVDNSKKINTAAMKEKVEKELENGSGTFSVFFTELLTGSQFGINENMTITAASLNKIPILAAVYYYAGIGDIDLEKSITLQEKDIQDYGTGSIRYDKPGTSYSIKTLARLMMEKSDNTAAYLLASEIIGMSEIQELVNKWGLTQTDMVNNMTSVKDMEIILDKMFKGQITTPILTQEMLDFMDDSDYEDRIPRGVPDNITVIHKTGDEIGKIHDVGIIELPDRPYYLGIMTTDQTDDEQTKNKMARISQIVFTEVTDL